MKIDQTSHDKKKQIKSPHTIMNQYDRIITDDTHIEKEYLQEIKDMLHNGLSFIYVDDKKINITVTSDFRKHNSRVTKVHIEGI